MEPIPNSIAKSLMFCEAQSLGQSREVDHWTASSTGLKLLLVWSFLDISPTGASSLPDCIDHSLIPAVSWPSFPYLLGHIIRRHEARCRRARPMTSLPLLCLIALWESLRACRGENWLRASTYARPAQPLESWKEWVSNISYWPCWPVAWPQAAGQDSVAL